MGGIGWGARGRVERTEYVGDCGGTAKRGMKSEEGRVRASTSARGWLEGAGDESELPEGGLRVRWNGANVGVGRPGREGGRERYAYTEGGFPRLRYRHHRRRGGLYPGLSNTRKSAT